MLNPNLQATTGSTPTEELVNRLIKEETLGKIKTSDIAFIGSDKENVPRHRFPDNCLRPAIENWYGLKQQYPRFLSLHLRIIRKSYSEEANIKWLQSIAEKKIPVVLFHPNPTVKSPTGREIYTLLENGYSWCTFKNESWTEPSIKDFPFGTGKVNSPFPPTLFVPKETNVEEWKTDLNKIIPLYYTLIEAHKPKKR